MKCSLQGIGLLVAFLCLGWVAPTLAQEYTSFRDLRDDPTLMRDYLLQGEYEMTVDGKKQAGLDVIADGDGKFRLVVFQGGLPGDGARPDGRIVYGTTQAGPTDFSTGATDLDAEFTKYIDDTGLEAGVPENLKKWKGKVEVDMPTDVSGPERYQKMKIKIFLENPDFPKWTFEKVRRESPTLGEKAPEGAFVVFDGKNLDNFKDGAKMNETPFGNTLWAEATSKPFENKPYLLHIEFMLSFMPTKTGQARSNSGVYIYQSYELQVLDSFGLEGLNNECGGFYRVRKPDVNMCYPPLTWQTYDIDFTPPKYDGDNKIENARVSIKQNGVVIHKDLELKDATPGCLPEGPGPRGLYLQGHGNKVQYRNIWVQYK